jgi:hypothetical protein
MLMIALMTGRNSMKIENYVEMTEGDSACAEDATSDGYSCNEMGGTDSFFNGTDRTNWVK